jgi:hypothetical protein
MALISTAKMENGMKFVAGWTVFVGLLWCAGLIGMQIAIAQFPDLKDTVAPVLAQWNGVGISLGKFITPILQLTLVLVVLISAAERIGFKLTPALSPANTADFLNGRNVQALIAIIIVVAVSVAGLADISNGLSALKDLALVVVGFYFGTRRREGELEAIAVGTATGLASREEGTALPSATGSV